MSNVGPVNGSKWNSHEPTLTPANVSQLRRAWGPVALDGVDDRWVVVGGLVITSQFGGTILALDARTGRLVWSGAIKAGPMVADGSTLYVLGSIGGSTPALSALDLTTGRLRWQRALSTGTSNYGLGFTASQGRVLLGLQDGTLRAFRESDGAAVWVSRVRVIGTIVVDAQRVVSMAAVDGAAPDELSPVVFDLRTGRVLWKGLGGGDYTGLVARDGSIWASTQVSVTKWQITPCRPDLRFCPAQWSTPTNLTFARFGGANASTYFVTGSKQVQSYDLTTGALKWTAPSHSSMHTTVAGDLLIGVWATNVPSGAFDVGFQAVDARGCGATTCPVLHQQQITDVDTAPYLLDPVVVDGRVILNFGNPNGAMAYSLPDQPAPPAPAPPKPLGWYPSGGQPFSYGSPGDRPLAGDWNGDGADNLGVHRGNLFLLRTAVGPGRSDTSFRWGRDTDTPLAGDWDGDGTDTVGIWRAGTFYLKASNTANGADVTAVRFGDATDTPLVGDWNGDGITDIGVKRGARYFLRGFGNFTYGGPADTPLVGDWNGDGTYTIAVKRGNRYYLSGNNTIAQYALTAGQSTDVALAADLLGDGTDELTLTR